MIPAFLLLFDAIIDLMTFVIFAMVVMSWLVVFGVVNPRHPIAIQVERTLYALTEPVLGPVRRIIPPLGGLDFSPLIVLVLLQVLRALVHSVVACGNLLGVCS